MELSIRITEEDFIKDKELFTKLKGLLSIKESNATGVDSTPVITEPKTEAENKPVQTANAVQQVITAAPIAPATHTPVTTAPIAPTAPTPTQVTPAPTAPAAEYTTDQLALACGALVDAGKVNELADLLNNKFGVAALPNLPKEQYNAFAVAIREMGAQI